MSPAQKNLLDSARSYLDELKEVELRNPPEFVFANMHGDIQVKMNQKSPDGLFVSFNSVEQLSRIVNKANMRKESFKVFDVDRSWADDAHDNSDDMGFGLFD